MPMTLSSMRWHSMPHDAIGGGQKQFALAGKISVDRPLADADRFGEQLGIGLGVTVLGEQLGGLDENLFLAAAQRASLHACFDGFSLAVDIGGSSHTIAGLTSQSAPLLVC